LAPGLGFWVGESIPEIFYPRLLQASGKFIITQKINLINGKIRRSKDPKHFLFSLRLLLLCGLAFTIWLV
jgi:hypothetical protein